MDWLIQNWFWVAIGALFIGMHLFGHGGHGRHGGHGGHGGGKEGNGTHGSHGGCGSRSERKSGNELDPKQSAPAIPEPENEKPRHH